MTAAKEPTPAAARTLDLPLALLTLVVTLVPLVLSGRTYSIETAKWTTFQEGTALLLAVLAWRHAGDLGFLRRLDAAAMAYFSVCFVSFVAAGVPPSGAEQLQAQAYQLLFYLMVRSMELDARRFQWLGTCWLGAAVAASGVAILQVVGHYTVRFGVPWETRATGTFMQPTFLGAYLAASTVLALDRALRGRSRGEKALALAALALVVTGLMLSLSRSGWLGAAAGGFVLVVLDRGLVAASRSLLPFVVVGLVTLGLLLYLRPPTNLDLSRIAATSSRSNQERIAIWTGTVELIRDNPWLGVGPGGFSRCFVPYSPPFLQEIFAAENMRAQHAHSELLHVAAESGLVGLALWLGVVVLAVKALLAREDGTAEEELRLRRVHLGMLAALLVNAAIGLDARFATSGMLLWYLVGMAASRQPVTREAGGVVLRRPLLVAMAVYLMWLPLDSLEADSAKMTGAGLHMTGRSREAEPYLEKAVALRPADGEAHFLRGRNFVAMKAYAEAEAAYLDAVRMDPNNPAVYYNLAKVYIRTGEFGKARTALARVLSINPRFELARYEMQRLERW
ncbi:MAG: O-antigen ligase family protein [Candidatus Riflebacteria bacterium]|nr:O-antigen ligase family protein [Candidatus Riflebacteria bacterium]